MSAAFWLDLEVEMQYFVVGLPMKDKGRDPHETLCPRCSGDAQWYFLDHEKSRVEIACPNCGKFAMPRASFEMVSANVAEVNDLDDAGNR